MISTHDSYSSNFTLELNILSNYAEHLKKTNAVLCTTPFYNFKITKPNGSANLFRK